MKAYKKSILREILSSKARFFSIMIIIFLGVAFYSGIKSSGPDMNRTINDFYREQNLMDSKIVSTLGLTDKDLELLKKDPKVLDYYGTYSLDVNLTNKNNLVKFMGYDKNNNINKFVLIDGKLPTKSGEIALDERAFKLNKDLKIGDEFLVDTDEDALENFKNTKFKIVGVLKSPLYIERESRGISPVGKGSVDYFALINKEDMNMKAYTEIYVRFKNVQGLNAYSKEYRNLMEENNLYLEELYSNRAIERVEEVKGEIKAEFKKHYDELKEKENLILDKEKELEEGKKQLEEGKNTFKAKSLEFTEGIKKGEEELLKGENQLNLGYEELKKQEIKLKEGEEKLKEAKETLNKSKEKLLSLGINVDEGTNPLKIELDKLTSLSKEVSSLGDDIKITVNNISEEIIPKEKILSWKEKIKALGLEDMYSKIEALDGNPKDKSLALEISSSLESKAKEINNEIISLKGAIEGVNSYEKGVEAYNKNLALVSLGKDKFNEANSKLQLGKEELNKGRIALKEGKVKGEAELKKAEENLYNAEEEIKKGENLIAENKENLAKGKKEIEEKEKEALGNLEECSYYIFDRSDNPGYLGYEDSIKSLDSIAAVLPVFFFVVAVLICLTTMTRMVEEKRIEIGTMKALGYGNLEISLKFLIYAALASVLGCILGILVGSNIVPRIINDAYTSLYLLPKIETCYYPSYILQALIISILCTVGASLFVVRVELKNKPSNLMRPKAPKLGKKILLERITPLWRRLNFNEKVTFRNIFRYKQRMFMTIFGIAGSMALLVTGFGLKDSNNGMANKQFDKIWNYETMVVFGQEPSKDELKAYYDTLKSIDGYEGDLRMHQEPVTFSKEGMNKQTVTLYVPEDKYKLDGFIFLNDRVSGEKYEIPEEGVIISEKLGELLGVSKGDTISFKDEDNKEYKVEVYAIAENYLMHSMYMSEDYYKKVFSKNASYNTDFINFKEGNNLDETEISKKLMDLNDVVNVTMTSQMEKATKDSAANMNVVLLVIILSAGLLAFVVLYNLNNINVSERIRELSTIKVLGFFDKEVTMYILRENIILTFLGMLTGSLLGKMLHSFIINTSETDTMMMYPKVSITSYVIAALITILFTVIVMILMHIKLKKVNMIDALKSNE